MQDQAIAVGEGAIANIDFVPDELIEMVQNLGTGAFEVANSSLDTSESVSVEAIDAVERAQENALMTVEHSMDDAYDFAGKAQDEANYLSEVALDSVNDALNGVLESAGHTVEQALDIASASTANALSSITSGTVKNPVADTAQNNALVVGAAILAFAYVAGK